MLLEIAKNTVGELKSALEEEFHILCAQSPLPPQTAQGLAHLVLENTAIKEEPRENKLAFRANIFLTSNQLLQEGDLDYGTFQHGMSISQNRPFSQLEEDLYSDLQSFARIESFKESFGPLQLIHRYNCAQVQGLLLKAQMLELYVPNHTTSHVRHLLRYIKFFQLLCTAQPSSTGLKVTIDGPASILGQSQRYGLKFAQFFPSILWLPEWKLQSQILVSTGARHNLPKTLELDNTCGIRSHYPASCASVAPEVTQCLETIQSKHPHWSIETGEATPLLLSNGDLLVPDFCLVHQTGKKVFVEVFQEWQTGPATRRVNTLLKHPQPHPIVLALPIKLKNLKDYMEITQPPPWAVLYRKSLLPDPIVKAAQEFIKTSHSLPV